MLSKKTLFDCKWIQKATLILYELTALTNSNQISETCSQNHYQPTKIHIPF